MKRLTCVILIIFLLLIGCGGTAAPKETKKQTYDGFMDWKAGMWTETTVKEGSSTLKIKTELLENSPSEARFQLTTVKGETETIAQMLYNPETGEVTKYILKDDEGVRCLDPSDAPKKRILIKDEDYPAGAAGVTLDKYTTTSGEEVTVAKFPTKDGEALVSSEVPFGIASVVAAGKATFTLDDFGTIGAKDALSEDELAQCNDRESVAEPAAQETSDEEEYARPAEDTASETTTETAAEEEANYEAEAIDTRTGEVQESFDCAKCDEMPNQMATNVCLASCK